MLCPDHQTWSQHRQTCVQGPEPPQKKPNLRVRLETPRARPRPPTRPPPPAPTPAPKNTGIKWPNPCNHPNIKYVPHPTNPQQYFTCRDGSLEGHSCGHGEVWIQPSHACINIQDRVPHTQSPNPCLHDSKQRFHPYPGDMHRYIECEAWYKMKVWDCGTNAVWMHSRQSCVAIAQPQTQKPPVPPVQTPRPTRPAMIATPPPPKPTKTATDFCLHSVSFYHPYKLDEKKFIQCDEYGNMYIRSCGPKKMWSDYFKTCVGHLHHDNITHSDGSNAGGNTGTNNGNQATAGAVNINLEPINYVNDFVQVTCPAGHHFDSNSNRCEDARNEIASDYNPSIYGPSCSDGFLWDTQMQMCVRAIKVDEIPTNMIPGGPSLDLDRPQVLPPGEILAPAPPPYVPVPTPEYTGPNPCVDVTDGYYFPFPGNARYFLQCNEQQEVIVKACPQGTMWTEQGDGYFSCMPWLVAVPGQGDADNSEPGLQSVLGEDDLATIAGLSRDNEEEAAFLEAINPCLNLKSERLAINIYPLDPTRYIQCSNGSPYIMSCAPGTMYDPGDYTCGHPVGADQMLASDELGEESGEEN